MPANRDGQYSFGHDAAMRCEGRMPQSSGTGITPSIEAAPAAFASGVEIMRCRVEPNGTTGTSFWGMRAAASRWSEIIWPADVHTEQFDFHTDEVRGDYVWHRLISGTEPSQTTICEIGQRDNGDTKIRLNGQTWEQAHTFTTSISANTKHRVRIVYERNDRIRVYLDGNEVVNETHSVDLHVIGQRIGVVSLDGGDALASSSLTAFVSRLTYLGRVALTESPAWVEYPGFVRAPGEISGVRHQGFTFRYDRGLHGDGGDETRIEAIVQVDTSDTFGNPVESDPVDVDGTTNWWGHASVPVAENTQYHWRVVYRRSDTQVVILTTDHGTFTSLSETTPRTIKIVVGGDTSESARRCPNLSYQHAIDSGFAPDAVIHLGDITYADQATGTGYSDSESLAEYRNRYLIQLLTRSWLELGRSSTNIFIWDGHEIAANYHTGNLPAWWEAAQQAYHECISAGNLNPGPIPDGLDIGHVHYYSFDTAGINWTIVDARRFRENSTSGQNNDRLGATQLAWLRSRMQSNSKPFDLFINPTPISDGWYNDEGTLHPRLWANGYKNQRDQILGDFSSNGGRKLLALSADIHKIGFRRIDFPNENMYEFTCAPLNQTLTFGSKFMRGDNLYFVDPFDGNSDGIADARFMYATMVIDEAAQTANVAAIDAETEVAA